MRNQSGRRLPNYMIGLIMMIILAVASYVAFTKQVPWGGGTEFKVVFNSAQNLRPNSPIRIAGVEVGKVKKVEALDADGDDAEATAAGSAPTGAVVTMEIDDDGLPWKDDATFTLKPRLFLEGNLFVDVRPGSPGAPVVDAGYTFPPAQTSNTVQLDEVLTGALPGGFAPEPAGLPRPVRPGARSTRAAPIRSGSSTRSPRTPTATPPRSTRRSSGRTRTISRS